MDALNGETGNKPAQYEKKMLLHSRIRTAASIAVLALMIAAFVIIVPDLIQTLGSVHEAAGKLSEITTELSGSAKDLDKLISSVTDMVDSNTQGVSDALEKVNSIDFDSLNSAIKDLSDVVAPLANISNMLGR